MYVDGNVAFVGGPMTGNPPVTMVVGVEENGKAVDRVFTSTGNVACDYTPFHSFWLESLQDMDTGDMRVK